MRILIPALLALGLGACGQQPTDAIMTEPGNRGGVGMVANEVAVAADSAGAPGAAPPQPAATSPSGQAAPGDQVAGRYLAYEYGFTVELPGKAIAALQDAQAASCRAAGPAHCLVIAANIARNDDGSVFGHLQLRMTPARVAAFRAALESQTGDAGGEITAANTTSEDLTRVIVDTEAALRAKGVLRERLIDLLKRPTGKVADLLEVERELARVQQEIDAATSELKVYRQRVDLALVSIEFRSERSTVGGDVGNPLADAFRDFFRIMADSAAVIVRFLAAILPVAMIGIPLVWLAITGWRRIQSRRKGSIAAVEVGQQGD